MSQECISVQKAKEMSGEEREQLIRKIEQHAHDFEVVYWGCSESVLDALQRYLNLGNNEVFKAAGPFAGGVARMREVCGALVGGVMAIGLAYGRAKVEDGKVCLEQPDFVEAFVRAEKLGEKFKEKFNGLRCNDVTLAVRGADYKRPSHETVEGFEDHAKCGDVTGPAARLAAEIVLAPTELFRTEINAILDEMSQVRKQQKSRSKAY